MKKKFIAKTILILCIVTTIFNASFAQLKKGNLLVEASFGNIGYSKYDSKNESVGATTKYDGSSFSFNLYPRVGFFVSDKFVVGAEVDIYTGSSKYNYFNATGAKSSDSKSSSTTLGVLPFVRYYFAASKNGKSFFYGQAGGGIHIDVANNNESRGYSSSTGLPTYTSKTNYIKKYSTVSGNASLGWNHFLSDNVALNFNLGYRYNQNKYSYTYTNTPASGIATTSPEAATTYINSGINWGMGFTMIIPRGKKK
jgi:hypothetical protein